jgi:hypothetical protein
VKRSFFQARSFGDAEDCNERLDLWVLETAGMRIHGTTGRRPLEVFRDEEASVLGALPERPFEAVIWHQAKVDIHCHVVFERAFYSVPWRHVGSTVWLRATDHSVVIYADNQRVATHGRILPGQPDRWATHEAHLPEGRREWRHQTIGYWLQKADDMGQEVGAYIREILDSDREHSQLRKVQAMVGFLEGMPPERAQAACSRAAFFANTSLSGLQRIIRLGLDLEPLPTSTPVNPHWSSEPRFARKATEFLSRMESHDESH